MNEKEWMSKNKKEQFLINKITQNLKLTYFEYRTKQSEPKIMDVHMPSADTYSAIHYINKVI